MSRKDTIGRVLALLESESFRLGLDLIHEQDNPEAVAIIARRVQRLLDEAQDQLESRRFPETAGNHFKADKTGGQELCVRCQRYWAPATRLLCAVCEPPPAYVPRIYTAAERGVQQREIEAITGAVREPHLPHPTKDEP